MLPDQRNEDCDYSDATNDKDKPDGPFRHGEDALGADVVVALPGFDKNRDDPHEYGHKESDATKVVKSVQNKPQLGPASDDTTEEAIGPGKPTGAHGIAELKKYDADYGQRNDLGHAINRRIKQEPGEYIGINYEHQQENPGRTNAVQGYHPDLETPGQE
jgi:hypothetical protein